MLLSLFDYFKNVRFIARESSIPSMNRKVGKHVTLHDFLYRTVYDKFDVIDKAFNLLLNDVNLLDQYRHKIKLLAKPFIDNAFEQGYVSAVNQTIGT